MSLPLFNQSEISLAHCALIRHLTATEAELLSEHLVLSDPWQTLGIPATGLKNYLLRDDASLYRYQIQVNQQTAGIVCLRYPWLRGPYIELLGLMEPYRGLGIGTELLQWLEQEVRPHVKNIWLAASQFNDAALRFYQRHGFVVVGTLDGLVHPDYDELLLRKQL